MLRIGINDALMKNKIIFFLLGNFIYRGNYNLAEHGRGPGLGVLYTLIKDQFLFLERFTDYYIFYLRNVVFDSSVG